MGLLPESRLDAQLVYGLNHTAQIMGKNFAQRLVHLRLVISRPLLFICGADYLLRLRQALALVGLAQEVLSGKDVLTGTAVRLEATVKLT